jgi:hypothetical protein
MESNYWFYTLSAVPQTLAAIMAFSATFFILKLGKLQQQKNTFLNDMSRFLALLKRDKLTSEILKLDDDGIIDILRIVNKLKPEDSKMGVGPKQYAKYKTEMEFVIQKERSIYKPSPQKIYDYLLHQKVFFEETAAAKRDILGRIKWNLFPVTLTITASLVLLPFHNWLSENLLVCIILLAIVLVLTVFSIILTAWNIYQISLK